MLLLACLTDLLGFLQNKSCTRSTVSPITKTQGCQFEIPNLPSPVPLVDSKELTTLRIEVFIEQILGTTEVLSCFQKLSNQDVFQKIAKKNSGERAQWDFKCFGYIDLPLTFFN
ncbi:hypothetical protein TNCV_844361 [Trichonephila clavipes]|uniref:Uncharacterized protein n=1 Tax=Trichonephila clavipes TaxID=2585209 RepID=A0A8X6WJ23_TRICX|nr:hypothetical protein TNCV_844361 [Trichonephila clavipes]